jgi:hypothetical protein
MVKVICSTFQEVPAGAVRKLLSKAVPFTVEDEAVIFSVED